MRQIGTLESAELAHRFTDYLVAEGTDAVCEQEDTGWVVWVRDENNLAAAKAQMREYLENPRDPRYDHASRIAGQVRAQRARQREEAARNWVDVRQRWRQPMARQIPVTMTLIVLSVVITLFTGSGTRFDGFLGRHLLLIDPSSQVPGETNATRRLVEILDHGQVWRIITPVFWHFGMMHLIFNMYMFYQVGGLIESRRGSLLLGGLVFLTAAAGNLGHYWTELVLAPDQNSLMLGGMSGVVYGLVGYVWIRGVVAPEDGLRLSRNIVVYIMIFLFIGFMGLTDGIGGTGSRVANWAHAWGLVSGMASAYLPMLWRR